MNSLMQKYLTYAGPCQWAEGWLMAFNLLGVMQVSIIKNTHTEGAELHIWDLQKAEPELILNAKNLTPEKADEYLDWIFIFLVLTQPGGMELMT